MELMSAIVHTSEDTPEIVDNARLAQIAYALRDLLLELERLQGRAAE
jgi:hypothetical protein